MVTPCNHCESANGVIMKRQATRANLFSALGPRRLVGYDEETDLLVLDLVGSQSCVCSPEVDQPRSHQPIDLLAAGRLLRFGKSKMKRHFSSKPSRHFIGRGGMHLHGNIALEIAVVSRRGRLDKGICANTLDAQRNEE